MRKIEATIDPWIVQDVREALARVGVTDIVLWTSDAPTCTGHIPSSTAASNTGWISSRSSSWKSSSMTSASMTW